MGALQQMLFGGGGLPATLIDSVQSVSIASLTTDLTKTATISSVDTTRSTVFYCGQTTTDTASGGADPNSVHGRLDLTSATVVTLTKNSTGSAVTANAIIVQWAVGVMKSVQRGTITLTAAASNTGSVSAVTATNSAVAHLGQSTSLASSAYSSVHSRANLTSSTVVTVTRGGTSSNVTASYEVWEFQSGILNSSAQEATTTLTAATSATTAISSVTTGNSLLLWGGFSGTNSNNDAAKRAAQFFSSATVVTAQKGLATDNATIVGTALEFLTQHVNFKDTTITDLITTGNQQANRTITAVNLSKAVINYEGYYSSGGSDTKNNTTMARFSLTSTTNQRCDIDAVTSVNDFVFGQTLEFK
jgi:hypothetical protein